MDAKTYFAEHDGKVYPDGPELIRVADACDITPKFLYQFALGHRTISAKLACDLEYATGGRINRRDSLPGFPWDRPVEQVRAAG